MARYTCYEELKDNVLELNDYVSFPPNTGHYDYIVGVNYLTNDNLNVREDSIFILLDITPMSFCTALYQYTPLSYSPRTWPDARYNDYEALTRVVLALYGYIEVTKKWKHTTTIKSYTEMY